MIGNLELLDIVLITLAILTSGFLFYAALISIMEKERRAAGRSVILAMISLVVFISPILIPDPEGSFIAIVLAGIFVAMIVLLLFPTSLFSKKIIRDMPIGQIDEKTIMFSRKLLDPDTDRYKDYYKSYPEHEEFDLNFRSKPGLLDEKTAFYDPFTFTASHAIFESITAFHPIVDGEPAPDKKNIDSDRLLRFIEKWVKKEGAISMGITETRDYHWYSVVGRGKDFGKEAQLPHSHAIAFTVEMDKELLDPAPLGPAVMESARQYMKAAVIATDVAMFIRKLGYHARAHVDGNYRVVCPLVAKDAGLGEIGRMGLLMTPELGPRVRIGVVTTDFALPVSKTKDHSHMITFCRICKKCADVCPSRAIPFDDRKEIDGVTRWQIKQEACFSYWCMAGTDCGKCISDCPYSHPDNLFHNIIRALIRNSSIFSYFALKMDDFFYGRKPKSSPVPDWLKSE